MIRAKKGNGYLFEILRVRCYSCFEWLATPGNIRRYVLYLYIETLKQRLDAINQLRVDRALAAMGPAFQQVYSLLPTLLHYHHPLMPGYLDGNVPRAFAFHA
jgi:adenylate cyclase class 1